MLNSALLLPLQEKEIISKNEIKEKKEITKIKNFLEGENMTSKYMASIILINHSPMVIFSHNFK
jgi:hypothetical protein